MKKSIFRILALVCSIALLFTGCSGGNTPGETAQGVVEDANVTAPGELPIVKEKIELTIGVIGTSKVENYETNSFTKYLEEKTNIDIKFYEFPSSGGYDKVKVMLASGTEMPDVICGFGLEKSLLMEYGSLGSIIDLTEYMDKYGYWTKEMFENTKVNNMDGWLKTADGKRYYMPHVIEQEGNVHGGKAFINKTWLDKLGLEMPETLEDFKKVMTAFKTQDPNGNGINDEIGFTGSRDGWNEKPVNFLMNSFIYDDYRDGIVVENDKIGLNYMSNDYKKGLKEISAMVKDGLVDAQSYTQSNEVLRSICSADTNIVGAFASGSPDSLFGSGNPRLGEYVALPPLKGPDGHATALKGDYGVGVSGIITKYCKYPLAAFRLMDFMLSEEASLFCRYGEKGVDWDEVDENTPALFGDIGYKARIMSYIPYGSVQNAHWFQYNPAFRSSAISDTMAWNGDELDGEYVKAKALKAYLGKGPEQTFTREQILLEQAEMEEFNTLQENIGAFVTENVSQFVTGGANVDKDWASFQKSLKNLEVERYLELYQKGYNNFFGDN